MPLILVPPYRGVSFVGFYANPNGLVTDVSIAQATPLAPYAGASGYDATVQSATVSQSQPLPAFATVDGFTGDTQGIAVSLSQSLSNFAQVDSVDAAIVPATVSSVHPII